MRIAAVFLCVVAFTLSGICRAEDKIPVTLDYSGDDAVGKTFEAQFKQALSASASYSPSRSADIRIIMLSLGLDAHNSTAASAISFTVTVKNKNPYDNTNPQTWYPLEVAHGLRIVRRSKERETAMALLAFIDDHLGRFFDDCKLKDGCL